MTTVMKDSQEGQPEHVCLCTKGNTVYLGSDIRTRQLERSIGGLQGQGYCVERLSLLNVEAVEFFSC